MSVRIRSALLVLLVAAAVPACRHADVDPPLRESASPAAVRQAASGPPTPERLAFWRGIRGGDDKPPAGSDVLSLSTELVGYLDSTDPAVRDELAYEVLARWIRKDRLLSPDELRRLISALYDRLAVGPGTREDDGVFGRSFSALILSVIAARDLDTPFLTDAEREEMVHRAGRYASDERDLRGHIEEKGWAHAAAHTADWMKFLARSPQLTPSEAGELMDGVLALTVRRHGFILYHGEDSRLAQPVLELLRRERVDGPAFAAWLERLGAPLREETPAAFDPALYAAQRDARNLVFTLFVALSLEDAPNPAQTAALAALRGLIHG